MLGIHLKGERKEIVCRKLRERTLHASEAGGGGENLNYRGTKTKDWKNGKISLRKVKKNGGWAAKMVQSSQELGEQGS